MVDIVANDTSPMLSELTERERALDRGGERRRTRERVVEPRPEVAIHQEVHPEQGDQIRERPSEARFQLKVLLGNVDVNGNLIGDPAIAVATIKIAPSTGLARSPRQPVRRVYGYGDPRKKHASHLAVDRRVYGQ